MYTKRKKNTSDGTWRQCRGLAGGAAGMGQVSFPLTFGPVWFFLGRPGRPLTIGRRILSFSLLQSRYHE